MENKENLEQDLITKEMEELRAIQLEGNKRMVTKARNALFWSAGLFFIGEMLAMARDGFDVYGLIFVLFVAAIFISLALYTQKKPYTAVVLGIIFFIGYILLVATLNAYVYGAEEFLKAIFGGIIIKIIILVNLFRALGFAKELQQAKENGF